MSKMIQVRNVPDRLHRELVRRARRRGQTLTEYIEAILEREVARPPAEEVFERIRRADPVELGRPAAELIREERAEGDVPAAERGVSLSAVVREAVERHLSVDDADARWSRALSVLGRFRSGHTDISVEHDRYLAEDFGP